MYYWHTISLENWYKNSIRDQSWLTEELIFDSGLGYSEILETYQLASVVKKNSAVQAETACAHQFDVSIGVANTTDLRHRLEKNK